MPGAEPSPVVPIGPSSLSSQYFMQGPCWLGSLARGLDARGDGVARWVAGCFVFIAAVARRASQQSLEASLRSV